MATWHQFAQEQPDLAGAGRELLFHPGFGFGYLATVRRDGGPRVHPVMPVLEGGRLFVFVVPSPKLADLLRDGRYALHSSGAENVNDEFYVTGRARAVDDPRLREQVRRAAVGSVEDSHVLVELDLDRALLAEFGDPPSWPPRYRVWRSGRNRGATVGWANPR